MKNLCLIISIIGLAVLFSACSSRQGQTSTGADSSRSSAKMAIGPLKSHIVGTWVLKNDINEGTKLIFKKDTCYIYADGVLSEKDPYIISPVSAGCTAVKSTNETNGNYVILTHIKEKIKECWYINKLSKTNFSYVSVGNGNTANEYIKK